MTANYTTQDGRGALATRGPSPAILQATGSRLESPNYAVRYLLLASILPESLQMGAGNKPFGNYLPVVEQWNIPRTSRPALY